jgi:hypothetical protein
MITVIIAILLQLGLLQSETQWNQLPDTQKTQLIIIAEEHM